MAEFATFMFAVCIFTFYIVPATDWCTDWWIRTLDRQPRPSSGRGDSN